MVLGRQRRAAGKRGAPDGTLFSLVFAERVAQFIKFCIVGGSGLFVDMAVLYLLADPGRLGLGIALSKICAAQAAMINNFIWNEVWTFAGQMPARHRNIFARFLTFNVICGTGIALAVLLLGLFHIVLGWNLYLSNLFAIGLVTCWNFLLNARFNWTVKKGLVNDA